MGTEGGEPRPRGLRPTEEDMAKHYAHLEHLRRKDKTLVGWTRRKVHQLSTVVCIAELTRGEVIGVLTVFFLIFGGLCRVCAVYIPQLLSYISRRAGLLHK